MADETGELADSPELFAELVVLLQQMPLTLMEH
mgnify:CR=1 FL=1